MIVSRTLKHLSVAIAVTVTASADQKATALACKALPDVVLLAEAEFCAFETFGVDSVKLKDHFAKNVWPNTYSVLLKSIKDVPLKVRATDLMGAEDTDKVAIVIKPGKKPGWLPKTAKPVGVDGAPVHAGGGGAEALQRVVLRCVIGADRGHYELSEKAASVRGLSSTTQKVIAEASRDADVFEWLNPAAHSQADIGTGGVTTRQEQKDALRALELWLGKMSKGVSEACKAHQPANAAYYIGYLLHAAQDLATHQGITNAEHSYLAAYDKNPDSESTSLDVAGEWSSRLLAHVAKAKPECWRELTTLADENVTVRNTFGPQDGTNEALFEYWRLGAKYKTAAKPLNFPPIKRWFDVTIKAQRDSFFETNFEAHVKP